MSSAWFLTNVAHDWPRPRRSRTERMYFCTVRLLTLMPSFKSLPRIRSAPHESVRGHHLPDQGDGLGCDSTFQVLGSRSPSAATPPATPGPVCGAIIRHTVSALDRAQPAMRRRSFILSFMSWRSARLLVFGRPLSEGAQSLW